MTDTKTLDSLLLGSVKHFAMSGSIVSVLEVCQHDVMLSLWSKCPQRKLQNTKLSLLTCLWQRFLAPRMNGTEVDFFCMHIHSTVTPQTFSA